jgi:hypothetical protein
MHACMQAQAQAQAQELERQLAAAQLRECREADIPLHDTHPSSCLANYLPARTLALSLGQSTCTRSQAHEHAQ